MPKWGITETHNEMCCSDASQHTFTYLSELCWLLEVWHLTLNVDPHFDRHAKLAST